MKRPLLISLAFSSLLVTGCPRNQYIVEMTPSGDGLERTLTCWREDRAVNKTNVNYLDFPATNLASLTKLYPNHQYEPQEQRHTFRGKFIGTTPSDVGGVGSFTRFVTSLGTVSIYSERFRGDDDLVGRLERGNRAADQVVDLLIGWFQAELGKESGFEQLRRFLDTQLRRDVKNVSLYIWQAVLAPECQKNVEETYGFRIGQYLVERGYFKPTELPLALTFFDSGVEHAQSPRFFQRLVARRLGVPETQPVPAALGFLARPQVMEHSWTNYLQTTDLYCDRLKRWEQERKGDPKLERPDPKDLVKDLIEPVFEFRFFASDDHLTVKLSLPVKPENTNGRWDPAARQVVWEAVLEEDKPSKLPALCYALWNQPDEAFQKQHFGKIALKDEQLTEYVLSCMALEKGHAQEWNAFLSSLKPGSNLETKLSAFHFADEDLKPSTPGVNPKESLAASVINKLKAGLQPVPAPNPPE